MTDKELEQKSDDLMRLFFSFCDDAELDKYIDEEELDRFYGHNNKGYIFGIYCYDGEDIIDVQWYKTEEERDIAYG